MRRLLLSLFPLPLLAVLVAISCGRSRSDEPASRVIPPAAPYLEPARSAAPSAPERRHSADEPPSVEEVREFERRVAK
jgi:hypothetical protein